MPDSLIQNLLPFLLAFTCIALGWYLGRRARPGAVKPGTDPSSSYFQGLNKRLISHPEVLKDKLVASPELLPATPQASIIAANLLRQQGRIEEAISSHQALLSAPDLPARSLQLVRLELARDYISAGQLDRAERLLVDLRDQTPELSDLCLQHLMEIYQDQSEWQRAIDAGLALLPKKNLLRGAPDNTAVLSAISHYYCELAMLAMAKNDYHAVRSYLKQALNYDRNCVRASLLLGEAEYNSQHYAEAVKVLHRIRKQDPAFIADSIVLLARCYEAQGQPQELYRYLHESMTHYPSTSLLLVLADEMQRQEGSVATARYLEKALRGQGSSRGMASLLVLYMADADGEAKQHLGILKQLIDQMLYQEPAYQCHRCGFEARHNHWLCPGCHQWGLMKPVQ